MRICNMALLTLLVPFALLASDAFASWHGLAGSMARRSCSGCPLGKGGCAQKGLCKCYDTMTITKTVYDCVKEQREKVVYHTEYDYHTVDDVRRVSKVQYRHEEFTYSRPVYETQSREVPYTVTWPVCETQSRDVNHVSYVPSYEKRTRSIPYTTHHPVCETHHRNVSYSVPRRVCYTKTIQVHGGHWETQTVKCPESSQKPTQKGERITCKRVWVPCVKEREITCHKTVYDVCTKQVPYTVTRMVPEFHTREVEFCVVRMMPVTKTRTVHYQVVRTMSEQRVKTVNYTVTRMVPETGIRCVPYTTVEEIPCTRTVCTPRQVPRTVCYMVTKRVPRTVTCEVRVPVCRPKPTCKGKGKSGSFGDWPLEGSNPNPEVPDPDGAAETAAANSGHLIPASLSVQSAVAPQQTRSFARGLGLYWNGEFAGAVELLRLATTEAPGNAKYAYFYALALHQAGRTAEADRALARAVELERQAPIFGWGRAMQRVQGTPRLWLEHARRRDSHVSA